MEELLSKTFAGQERKRKAASREQEGLSEQVRIREGRRDAEEPNALSFEPLAPAQVSSGGPPRGPRGSPGTGKEILLGSMGAPHGLRRSLEGFVDGLGSSLGLTFRALK